MDTKILLRVLCILMFLFALSGIVFGQPTQQPSLYDQLNAASADVTTIMANLRSAVIQGQNQIAALNTKIEALTKERDELKAAAAKPAEPAK